MKTRYGELSKTIVMCKRLAASESNLWADDIIQAQYISLRAKQGSPQWEKHPDQGKPYESYEIPSTENDGIKPFDCGKHSLDIFPYFFTMKGQGYERE
jgi:hypothetical protein